MPQFRTALDGKSGVENDTDVTNIAAAGNIVLHSKRITHHAIQGGGGALALTIDAPTPADDGKIVTFWSEGAAAAHVITQAVVGFNGKAAAGTATWAGLVLGESLILIAHGGNWWNLHLTGVVIA